MHGCMTHVIRGWKPASRFCGVPVRSIRKAVAEGALHASKQDGVWTFTIADLQLFAAQSGATTPPAQPAAPEALEADPEPELAGVTGDVEASRETPPIADFLLAACEPARPAERAPGEPLGASRTFGRSWLDQIPVAAAPAQLVEIDAARRDAAAARAQAEQAAQAVVEWRAAYRHERVQAIAGAIALEVLAAGHRDVQVVHGVRDAVVRALQQLSDAQLGSDAYAWGLARATASQLIAWQMHAVAPVDDLSRARLRRSRR